MYYIGGFTLPFQTLLICEVKKEFQPSVVSITLFSMECSVVLRENRGQTVEKI